VRRTWPPSCAVASTRSTVSRRPRALSCTTRSPAGLAVHFPGPRALACVQTVTPRLKKKGGKTTFTSPLASTEACVKRDCHPQTEPREDYASYPDVVLPRKIQWGRRCLRRKRRRRSWGHTIARTAGGHGYREALRSCTKKCHVWFFCTHWGAGNFQCTSTHDARPSLARRGELRRLRGKTRTCPCRARTVRSFSERVRVSCAIRYPITAVSRPMAAHADEYIVLGGNAPVRG
jgi:hypothetical protein